ncbi:SDR family oxidoreductase [Nocardioides endophyticus]|uniref:SDR family oxidoreductase n=1 Tax=Nocardioides endophyticus TaxID=1353775 RepID=A0ABP8Z461_9ACTN
MTTYLVTGATGNLGSRITRQLTRISPVEAITALVRPGAETSHLEDLGVGIVRGHYEDLGSLRHALGGVTRLVLVSSPILDPTARVRQHRNVIEQAVGAGVEHVVYTSALGAEHDPGHFETEQALERSVPSTILRNGLYSEPFARRALNEAVRSGSITSSTGGHPVRTASWDDLAEAACLAVTAVDPQSSIRRLNGTPWTYDELARHLAARLGRSVTHQEVADDESGPLGQLHALFRHGLLTQSPDELTGMLRRAPRSIEVVVDALLGDDTRREA